MTLEGKRLVVGGLGFLFLGSLVAVALIDARRQPSPGGRKPPVVPADSRGCYDCHAKVTPLAVQQWADSKHGEQGISCMACHGRKQGAADAYLHHEALISSVVTPRDCGSCHKNEVEEFALTAHGARKPGLEIKLSSGKPDVKTWPAPLVGRINPDGSAGSCTTCHGRHRFAAEDAKKPAICESCHLADGAAEAWRRSAHGGLFLAAAPGEAPKAPSCAVCHLGGAAGKPGTHDLTKRLSWTLAEGKLVQRKDADKRRDSMFEICLQCHADRFVDGSLQQVDATFANPPASADLPAWMRSRGAWPHFSVADRRASQLR